LEHFPVTRFADLQSILFQVVMALSIAEEACEFEHRDLHWGNILVAREQEGKLQYRFR
jgi:serine/threonine-protein kinase haspin